MFWICVFLVMFRGRLGWCVMWGQAECRRGIAMQTEKKKEKKGETQRGRLRWVSPNAIASFQEVGSSLPIGQQPDPHLQVTQVLSQTNLSISSIIHPLIDGPTLLLLKRDPGLFACQQVWTFLVSWAEFTRSEFQGSTPALVTPLCLSALFVVFVKHSDR